MAQITERERKPCGQAPPADRKMIRDALLRLRQLGAQLPPVDAAALVREIRDAGAEKDSCQSS